MVVLNAMKTLWLYSISLVLIVTPMVGAPNPNTHATAQPQTSPSNTRKLRTHAKHADHGKELSDHWRTPAGQPRTHIIGERGANYKIWLAQGADIY